MRRDRLSSILLFIGFFLMGIALIMIVAAFVYTLMTNPDAISVYAAETAGPESDGEWIYVSVLTICSTAFAIAAMLKK